MTDEREIDRYMRERAEKLEDLMSRWIEAKRSYLIKKDDKSKRAADSLFHDYIWLLVEGEGAGMELPEGWHIAKPN